MYVNVRQSVYRTCKDENVKSKKREREKRRSNKGKNYINIFVSLSHRLNVNHSMSYEQLFCDIFIYAYHVSKFSNRIFITASFKRLPSKPPIRISVLLLPQQPAPPSVGEKYIWTRDQMVWDVYIRSSAFLTRSPYSRQNICKSHWLTSTCGNDLYFHLLEYTQCCNIITE